MSPNPAAAQDSGDQRALAQSHMLSGRYAAAAAAYRTLVESEPHAPNLRYDLGAALSALGDKEGAADAWSTARVFHGLALLRELGVDMERFAADPDFAAETGRSLAANGLPGVAGAALARVLEAKGPEAQIIADYAVCLLHQGAVEEACEVLAMAGEADVASLGPLLMAAYGFVDDGGLRRSLLARQSAATLEDGVAPMNTAAAAGEVLKVGYVAGAAPLELRFLAVIARHDPSAVEAVLLVEDPDAAPEGFTAFSIGGLSDREAAQAIAAFGFDILVDLSGPGGGRLGLFAHRPATAQVSWNGDLHTTGLTAMDAKLMPTGCNDPDAALLFTEKLIPMGPVLAPWPQVQVEPKPVNNGRFVFGAFMAPALMCQDTISAIARAVILQPESRVMLKHAVMDDPVIQRVLAARFLACGVPRERLDFRGMAGPELDQFDFDDCDLALDGRPSMGEAQVLSLLGRGVPVLCAAGPTTRGRLVAAPLRALGLDALVADNLDHLVARALELSDDRTALAALRDRIEAAFTASAYGDAGQVARGLEGAFAKVVKREAGRRSAAA